MTDWTEIGLDVPTSVILCLLPIPCLLVFICQTQGPIKSAFNAGLEVEGCSEVIDVIPGGPDMCFWRLSSKSWTNVLIKYIANHACIPPIIQLFHPLNSSLGQDWWWRKSWVFNMKTAVEKGWPVLNCWRWKIVKDKSRIPHFNSFWQT